MPTLSPYGFYPQAVGKYKPHAVKGNCRDNTPMDSFFSSLKTGCVHRTRFKTFKQAKAALFDYIEVFYNRQRLHSTIGYKTPLEAFNKMIGQVA